MVSFSMTLNDFCDHDNADDDDDDDDLN